MAQTAPKAGNDLLSYVIDGMIQGVTQQSQWDRRDTQCNSQFDCVNSPVNGCEARPGFDFIKLLGNTDHSDSFCYEIFRGDAEHYLVVIDPVASPVDGHKLHVYDLQNNGVLCTITYDASEDYLACVNPPKQSLMATTLNDFTFLGNREVNTAMSTTLLSPAKVNEGIIFVKAGGYLVTYQCAITFAGSVYTWTYVTPDNSTESNAAYISTNQIAAAFFRSFTGVDAIVTTSGTQVAGASQAVTLSIANPAVITWATDPTVDQPFKFSTTGVLPTGVDTTTLYYAKASGQFALSPGGSSIVTSGSASGDVTATFTLAPGAVAGVGAAGSGDLSGVSGAVLTGSDTLVALGFTVSINGSVIKISRTDAQPFDIDTGDGVGDTYFLCAKDTVQSFDDLPASCFKNFTVKVIGSNEQTDDDYYVQFQGADGSSGYWEEVIAPGTPLTFDPTTMPLALVNTGPGTFDFKVPPWGNRVAGDGIYTSLDPSFIGFPLQEMSMDNGRFALMWEGGCVWSRAINNFVFFPDSAQTVLDSDPIDVKPAGGSTIALLRRMVHTGETTFLWAEKIQFRATSGVNPFTQQTVELPPSTYYEFTPQAIPKAVGQSLYFATEIGAFCTLRDLSVQNNLPVGAVDITAHVKSYIPSGLRWIAASDTLGLLFGVTDGDQPSIYCYNYLLSATARLQSAWNKWRLPSGSNVLWAGIDLNYLYALVQRQEGAVLLRADLTVNLVDPDEGATYLTRLDMRIDDTQVVSKVYNPATNETCITLPYPVPEATGWTLSTGTKCPMMVINRDSTGTRKRGHSWSILSFPSLTKVVVQGDCTGDHWYVGFRITASRSQSTFYIKTNRGLVPTKDITVKNYQVNFGNTGYTRAEVSYNNDLGNIRKYEMQGGLVGSTDSPTGQVPITTGTFDVEVNEANTEYSLELINDSFLPSRWISCVYQFTVGYHAKPTEFGQSVPSYFNQGGSAGYANNF